jgi:hypothetical protein
MDQIKQIFAVLGTPTDEDWPGWDKLPYFKTFKVRCLWEGLSGAATAGPLLPAGMASALPAPQLLPAPQAPQTPQAAWSAHLAPPPPRRPRPTPGRARQAQHAASALPPRQSRRGPDAQRRRL